MTHSIASRCRSSSSVLKACVKDRNMSNSLLSRRRRATHSEWLGSHQKKKNGGKSTPGGHELLLPGALVLHLRKHQPPPAPPRPALFILLLLLALHLFRFPTHFPHAHQQAQALHRIIRKVLHRPLLQPHALSLESTLFKTYPRHIRIRNRAIGESVVCQGEGHHPFERSPKGRRMGGAPCARSPKRRRKRAIQNQNQRFTCNESESESEIHEGLECSADNQPDCYLERCHARGQGKHGKDRSRTPTLTPDEENCQQKIAQMVTGTDADSCFHPGR